MSFGRAEVLHFQMVPMFFIQPNGLSTNLRLIALIA